MVDQEKLYEHSWVFGAVHSDWEDWKAHLSIWATVMRRFSDHGNRGTDCPIQYILFNIFWFLVLTS